MLLPALFHQHQLDFAEEVQKQFENFLKDVNPDIVHFQHTIRLSSSLIDIAQSYAKKTILSLQDFWYFCPRIHLLRPDGTVCAGPEFGLNCLYCRTKKIASKQGVSISKKIYKAMPIKVSLTIKKYIKDVIEKRKQLRTEREYIKILPFIVRYYYVMEILKSVDYILSPSQFLASFYMKKGGIDSSKIKTITLGIVPFKIEKRKTPKKPIRFGFAGSPKRHKGSYLLLEAFNRIPHDEATLIIWGRGWGKFPEDIKS